MSTSLSLRAELLTLCDYALTDSQGKLSLIGMFDKVFTQELPSHYSRFYIVAILNGEPGQEYAVGLRMVDADDVEVIPLRKIQMSMGEGGKSNIVTTIQNLHISSAGAHRIQLLYEDEVIGETSLDVVKVNTPQTTQTEVVN